MFDGQASYRAGDNDDGMKNLEIWRFNDVPVVTLFY